MSTKENEEKVVITTNDRCFSQDVLEVSVPVLVDFWAPWCGPCRMIAPVVEELGGEYSARARMVKLNVDENPRITAQYGIASIPTLLLFKDGKVVDQVIGAASKRTIAARLEAHLNG